MGKWNDLSHEGRYIRRAFNLAKVALRLQEETARTQSVINLFDLEQLVGIMTKCAKANTDIIKVVDHDNRLRNIEEIIENIPPDVILEVKAKLGK